MEDDIFNVIPVPQQGGQQPEEDIFNVVPVGPKGTIPLGNAAPASGVSPSMQAQAPFAQTPRKGPISTQQMAKYLPMMTSDDQKAMDVLAAQNEKAMAAARAKREASGNYPLAQGAIPTFLTSAANMAGYGLTPYIAGGMMGVAQPEIPYNMRTGLAKEVQSQSEKAHPWASGLGTVAGLGAGMLTGSGELNAAKLLAQGAGYGATQGGTALEDMISGKNSGWELAGQVGTGAGTSWGLGKAFQAVSPTNLSKVSDAAKRLGVSIPASIMNPSAWYHSETGMSKYIPAVQQTARGIYNRVSPIFGNLNPSAAIDNGTQAFLSRVSQLANTSGVSPSISKLSSQIQTVINNKGDLNNFVLNTIGENANKFKRVILNSGSDGPAVWDSFRRGVLGHMSGHDGVGAFSLLNLHRNWSNIPEATKRTLTAGMRNAKGILDDVATIASETTQKSGQNLIDQFSRTAAPKKMGWKEWAIDAGIPTLSWTVPQFLNFLPDEAKQAVGVLGTLAGGTKAARHLAAKPASRIATRNVAAPGAIRGAVEKAVNPTLNAVRRGITSATTAGGQNLHDISSSVAEFLPKEAELWYRKHAPWVFGGRASGGRVAYKSGGKVTGIEPMVQSLMQRYKQAKSSETKTTEPLLDEQDHTIVKALDVAKKAI